MSGTEQGLVPGSFESPTFVKQSPPGVSTVPVTTCPQCSRKIQIELHEMEIVIQCARCDAKFVPVGSASAEEPAPEMGQATWDQSEPPVRTVAHANSPEPGLPTGYMDYTPEPWYYGFLETYARVELWIGIALIACGGLGSLIVGIKLIESFGAAGAMQAAMWCLVSVLGAAYALFLLLVGVAFILLIVDEGRNLREIRRGQSEIADLLRRAVSRKT